MAQKVPFSHLRQLLVLVAQAFLLSKRISLSFSSAAFPYVSPEPVLVIINYPALDRYACVAPRPRAAAQRRSMRRQALRLERPTHKSKLRHGTNENERSDQNKKGSVPGVQTKPNCYDKTGWWGGGVLLSFVFANAPNRRRCSSSLTTSCGESCCSSQ